MSDTYFDSVEANVDGTKQSVPVRDSAAVHTDEIASEFESLVQSQNIDALDTTSKNLVGGINELNSKSPNNEVKILGFIGKRSLTISNITQSNLFYGNILLCASNGICDYIRINSNNVYTVHLGTINSVNAEANVNDGTISIDMQSSALHGFVIVGGGIARNRTIKFL